MLDDFKGLDRSSEVAARLAQVITAGTNSPGRLFRDVDTPIIIAECAHGARITDVDGNEYIDFMMGLGPNILGHAPSVVTEALSEQLGRGAVFGINCELEYELASRIVGAVSHVDELRFTCSGTEAVMTAVRVARAHTGRFHILKFRGGYHGHSDGMLTHAAKSAVRNNPLSVKDGIPDAVRGATLIARYNDSTEVEQLMREMGSQIAAIIVEPVATNMGLILPDLEFLQTLRRCCDSSGTVLIFDEVVSGFRCRYGTVSDILGVSPDLTTFGKIIGGGLPVGAFGGRRELMEQVGNKGGVFQGGSFAGNPLTMAAGIATLDRLASGEVFEQTTALVERYSARTKERFLDAGIPLRLQSFATMATYIFNDEIDCLRNFDDVEKQNSSLYAKFHYEMVRRGVLFAPTIEEPIFFGAAHSEQDIDYTVDQATSALRELIEVSA